MLKISQLKVGLAQAKYNPWVIVCNSFFDNLDVLGGGFSNHMSSKDEHRQLDKKK